MEKKQQRFSIGYFILVFIIIMMVQNYFASPHTQTITYSQFKDLVQKGLVENLSIGEKIIHGSIKGAGVKEVFPPEKLKDAPSEVKEGKKPHPFNTIRVEDPGLTDELNKARILFQGELSSNWISTILSWVVPTVIFFLLWGYLMKKMGGQSGLMQIGKSKAKVYIEKKTGVTFADVAGIDEAEDELVEVVQFLKNPEKYQRLGVHIPKAYCWLVLQAPGGLCLLGPLRVKQKSPSSASPVQTLLKCSSALERRASETSSPKRRNTPQVSSSLMSL